MVWSAPARSAGRYRLYTPDLLDLLKRIKYLRDVKRLNVPGIKQALGSALPAAKGANPLDRAKPTAELGEKLRRLRKKRGLTVTQAAQGSADFRRFPQCHRTLARQSFGGHDLPAGSGIRHHCP